jgi:hypothetical protein
MTALNFHRGSHQQADHFLMRPNDPLSGSTPKAGHWTNYPNSPSCRTSRGVRQFQ